MECKNNNDLSVLHSIQENTKCQFEPYFKELMTKIETNDSDNFKDLW